MAGRMNEQGATFARGTPVLAALLACVALAGSASAVGQPAGSLPFAVGERLTYRAGVSGLGTIGRGAMWIEGPDTIRGRDVVRLRFEFMARVGFVKAMDRTDSWLDPDGMTGMRFLKEERHPLSKHEEAVELYPDDGRWTDGAGGEGEFGTEHPLDELSFMYFVRTLPLDADTLLSFDRHYDEARNPTTVRMVGRDTIETGAGRFAAVELEMRVKDARRYRGEGVIRIHVSDDVC